MSEVERRIELDHSTRLSAAVNGAAERQCASAHGFEIGLVNPSPLPLGVTVWL